MGKREKKEKKEKKERGKKEEKEKKEKKIVDDANDTHDYQLYHGVVAAERQALADACEADWKEGDGKKAGAEEWNDGDNESVRDEDKVDHESPPTVGSRVVVTGLRNAALNGQTATVVSWDGANTRYELRIDGMSETRLI